jgi:endonuclease YncB( thermonuclease family)
VDGDTFICKIHVGVLDLTLDNQWIRLLGVDTKELTGNEREWGLQAASYTRSWLVGVSGAGQGAISRPFVVDIWGRDNFGRVLLGMWDSISGECLNTALVRDGYSMEISPYSMIGSEFWETRQPREVVPVVL